MRPEIPSLADAEWLRRNETEAVFDLLERAGFPAMAVGGVVRNSLMGLPVADIDIATPATPDQVIQACRNVGISCIETGVEHGTVTVVVDHQPFEVTTLRKDVATDGRRATVAFTSDWAEDAARRDFTVNALYCDRRGRVVDPLGGYADVFTRRIRFIGDSDRRIAEDYLRILRFFRFFAAIGEGEADKQALDACVRGRVGLKSLSAERVRAEFVKLLVAPRVLDAIDAMCSFGLLTAVLGVAPRPGVLRKMCAAEKAVAAEALPMMRLSALAVAVEEDRPHLADRFRLSKDETNELTVIAGVQAKVLASLNDGSARRMLYAAGSVAWQRHVLAGLASDVDISRFQHWYDLPKRWQVPKFPVRGTDVLAHGVPPGPRVGEIMRRLEQWWIDTDFASDHMLKAQLAIFASEK